MNKEAFLAELRRGLSGLPEADLEEHLTFYREMIDDRMEEGLSEEEAVHDIGNADELAAQIIADIPLTKLVKEKITPRKKLGAWEIVLLVLGSPVWVSLLIAVLAVFLSLYAVLWAVILSLWAVFAALTVCGPAFVAAGIYFIADCSALTGAAVLGAGLFCAGLAVFMFFVCKAVTKGILRFTGKAALRLKNRFMKKEEKK